MASLRVLAIVGVLAVALLVPARALAAAGGWSGVTTIGRLPAASAVLYNQVRVACGSPSFCVAVDTNGDISTYDGGSWKPRAWHVQGAIGALSCDSAAFCVAIDGDGNAITWDGSSWSAPVAVDTGPVESVSCTSPSFCVAVDDSGSALSWDGKSWSPPATMDGDEIMESVACASASLCVAVDLDGRVVQWNGSTWSAPAPLDGTSRPHPSVSCSSTGFCVLVDSHGLAATYNGGSWTRLSNVGAVDLEGVSCATATFCVAVGAKPGGRGAEAAVYDGRSWTQAAPKDIVDLQSISCPSSSFCMAVGVAEDGAVGALSFSPGASSSHRECSVPDVKGLVLARARSVLGSHGCRLAAVRHRVSKSSHRNRVIAQSVRPGTKLPAGGPVGVTIGTGRRPAKHGT
jgi:hypothetical protein